MANWRDAIADVPGGARILVEATAGAKGDRFPDGFNPWREGRIGVRVSEPAADHRANLGICRVVARFFGIPASDVRIVAGATDSRKSILVAGPSAAHVRALLEPPLDAGRGRGNGP